MTVISNMIIKLLIVFIQTISYTEDFFALGDLRKIRLLLKSETEGRYKLITAIRKIGDGRKGKRPSFSDKGNGYKNSYDDNSEGYSNIWLVKPILSKNNHNHNDGHCDNITRRKLVDAIENNNHINNTYNRIKNYTKIS